MFQEVKIKKALETEIQPDGTSIVTIDAYNGCQLQCPYCFQMNNREWSRTIYIRTNIADVLEEELKTVDDEIQELYIGSLSDPYMDIEKEYGLTRRILEVLKDMTYEVFITTKAVNELILRDMELLKDFNVKPVILLGLSHVGEADKGAFNKNISIANQLHEAGIMVRVFITPVLPYIMNIEEMIAAIHPGIMIYIDKLRVFERGNQNGKMYEWIKKNHPMYQDNYFKILFEGKESYYHDLVHQYQNNDRITFMSELWNEE